MSIYNKIDPKDLEDCYLITPTSLWEIIKYSWYLYTRPRKVYIFAKLNKDWVNKNLNF